MREADDGDDETWPDELDLELEARAAAVAAGHFHTLEEVLEWLRAQG